MSDKLPPNHSASAHKDKVGRVMHEFKRGQLHSGTGDKGKKGPTVKSRAQAIAIGLGYTEDAALIYAEILDFISAKEASDAANRGETSDIDATPGKQKPANKIKQDEQGIVTTFPTLPKQAPGNNYYNEGVFIKKNKKAGCPPGTQAVGGGMCKNPKPGGRQYFEVEKGKGCPPGSKSAGKGRCRVDFAEPGAMSQASAQSAAQSVQDTPCEKKKKNPEQPKKEQATPTPPTSPTQPTQPISPEKQMVKDAAKKRAEQCAKQTGN
jgi:hypothetical protein